MKSSSPRVSPRLRTIVKKLFLAVVLCAVTAASAQTAPSANSATAQAPTVTRTTKAVHYRLQGGTTKIDFQGTDLLQRATGEARVEGKKTNFQIEVKFQNLEDATKFGLEYLTYVLWAVSPQGRPVNLGEVSLEHGNAHLKAFTDLQTFGMIVTAEPYFAVTAPGNMVVMESAPAAGTGTENIEAKYDLVSRGTYSSTNTHIQDAIFGIDSKTPLELFEARNALRIARIAGDKYAAFIISKAGQQLMHAEEAYRQKQNKAAIEAAAKEATETAEEARLMAVKQKAEDEAQAEAAAREAKARADANAEARRRADAETARAQAETARAEAEQAKAEALKMKQEAEAAAQEAARQKAEAEKATAEAVAQQQALAAETDKARRAAAQSDSLRQQAENDRQRAEYEKQELRARLLQQLNSVLATRDSARGLVANMSDVLFRSGSFELLPGARERLAKVSGIVLAYPSMHVAIEGHTDSIGTDDYNQQLSERRAQAVRDYFVQQGIASVAVEAHGYGKTEPIATNDTPEGRQQNRRVELILSGDAIGTASEAAPPQTASTQQRQ
jgi:outer membrane protein OmpA-like peptidoglycan-associated protein